MSKVRRIVTGFNDEGRSIILMDAEATNHRDHFMHTTNKAGFLARETP